MDSRANSFLGLRLIAATIVLVGHASELAGGPDPRLGRLDPGHAAVLMFFGTSGFLITRSWQRDPRWRHQVIKRVLRIYPPLLVVLVLSTLVMGPLVTDMSLGAYLTHPTTWSYLGNNTLLWDNRYELPGVFTDNPFPEAVNGSLWTLKSEIRAYIVVAILGVFGFLGRRKYTTIILIAFAFAITFGPGRLQYIVGSPSCLRAFAVGALLFLWREHIPWKGWLPIAVAVGWIASAFTPAYPVVEMVAVPYLSISLAYALPNLLRSVTKRGDFSYGTYLYAFPLAQLVVFLWPGISVWQSIAVNLVLAYACAYVSWQVVESPALRLKARLTGSRVPGTASQQEPIKAAA